MRNPLDSPETFDRNEGCERPDLSPCVTQYCFGEIGEEQRARFEAHLLECDFCWQEVQRLDAAVRALRADRSLTRLIIEPATVGLLGISSKLDKPLSGHLVHALLASTLYGLLYAVTVFMEVAYEYDRFSRMAWASAPVIFLWILVSTLTLLGVVCKLRSGRHKALFLSLAILVAAAAGVFLALRPFLPDRSVTLATFQTYTAQAAYLKGIFYFLPFAAIFLVLPFHFVVMMQRELRDGRHRAALDLLTGSIYGIAPHGMVFPRFWVLACLLTLGTIVSFFSTHHLFENLKVTTFTSLFIQVTQLRWLLYLGLGVECLAWYYQMINELKRECLAVFKLIAK